MLGEGFYVFFAIHLVSIRMLPDPKTELVNRLLLLWLIDDASKRGSIGITKTHKLTFLSQYEMTKQKEKGFSYNFTKWEMGPVSTDLADDVFWLGDNQFINIKRFKKQSQTIDGQQFKCSKMGLKILNDFREMFVRNNMFTQKIYAVNRQYAGRNSQELVQIVHSMPNPSYCDMSIHDTPLNELILGSLSGDSVKHDFVITPEEEATLELYLDEECYRSVSHACVLAQSRPFVRINDVC